MNRVVMYLDETHVVLDDGREERELAVGERLPVFRGGGPHDGTLMGHATVINNDETGEMLAFEVDLRRLPKA
jgi:hypothetical protein